MDMKQLLQLFGAILARQDVKDRKEDAEALMADHVLLHGLPTATLRPLAAAAGTSDRMLIYRYGSKEALVARLLAILAHRLTAMLEAAPTPAFDTAEELMAMMAAQLTDPAIAPYRAVWLELVAIAARGNPAAKVAAGQIIDHFAGWLEARLPQGTLEPAATAARMLATIEGAVVLSTGGETGLMLIQQAFRAR
jgi:AcrR family transcriptional regulator